MATPGPVLLKCFTRNSKYDLLVEEVELLEANPRYAHVRFPNGSEDTVANKHLAPLRDNTEEPQTVTEQSHDQANVSFAHEPEQINSTPNEQIDVSTNSEAASEPPVLRRSQRTRRQPDRLAYS